MKFIVFRTSEKENKPFEFCDVNLHLSKKYVFKDDYDDGLRIYTIEINNLEELVDLFEGHQPTAFSRGLVRSRIPFSNNRLDDS